MPESVRCGPPSRLSRAIPSDGAAARLSTGNPTITTDEDGRDALDTLTSQGCANAKTVGVTIYTVAFSTPGDAIDTEGLDLLSACASPGKAFVANDATALKAAFKKISTGMGNLRLTQ